jgi:hypothetical protein
MIVSYGLGKDWVRRNLQMPNIMSKYITMVVTVVRDVPGAGSVVKWIEQVCCWKE